MGGLYRLWPLACDSLTRWSTRIDRGRDNPNKCNSTYIGWYKARNVDTKGMSSFYLLGMTNLLHAPEEITEESTTFPTSAAVGEPATRSSPDSHVPIGTIRRRWPHENDLLLGKGSLWFEKGSWMVLSIQFQVSDRTGAPL